MTSTGNETKNETKKGDHKRPGADGQPMEGTKNQRDLRTWNGNARKDKWMTLTTNNRATAPCTTRTQRDDVECCHGRDRSRGRAMCAHVTAVLFGCDECCRSVCRRLAF